MKLKSFRFRNASQVELDEFDKKVNDWIEKQKTPITIEYTNSITECDNYATLLIFYSTRKDKLEKIND